LRHVVETHIESWRLMSAVHKLPVEYNEPDNDTNAPVVTLIGSNLPAAYLEEAEPSPLMERASHWWQGLIRTAKLSIILALVGGYPAMMVASHKVDSGQIVLSQASPWASLEVGTSLTLLGRELTNAGWADDSPAWHPRARLTALPAWQEGVSKSLSEFMLLSADLSKTDSGQVDSDLQAAGRLLAPASDAEGIPRLNAAAEALQRYEGRLARGLATQPRGGEAFAAEVDLIEKWATESKERLQISADRAEAWPASRRDIEAIYLARAQAHVASQLLNATLLAEPDLLTSRDAAEARDRLQLTLRRAATFNPVFISSQAGTGRFLSDHPATMAYYMDNIVASVAAFELALSEQAEPRTAIADAG
jgi:hypothetical protein